jgi:type I restriction enzyme, S subunit
MARETRTGGRDATTAVVPGRVALSIGDPGTPTPNGYAWRPLSDMARLESGHTPSRSHPEYWDGDIPWIGIPDASDHHGQVVCDTYQHVTAAGVANSSTRLLPAGTVCLSRTASIGYVVTMGRPMCTSQDFVNWVCGPELDHRYLHYLLMLEADSIRESFAFGTTHRTLYYPDAKAFHVMVPRLDQQQAIAEVLGALDDKIAANAGLIDTIDELMATLYRQRASARAMLTSLARFVNGRNFTKEASGDGRVVIRIAELNSGIGGSTVFSDADANDENLARPGDILFAWSGSLTVQRWTKPEGLVNQHIFKVVPVGSTPSWLVHQALLTKLPEFQAIAAGKATTMGHIQRRHLEIDVAIPDREACGEMQDLMQGLWDRAVTADCESQTLAELRDTLLPALMDGTIRVKDAIATAEEVL